LVKRVSRDGRCGGQRQKGEAGGGRLKKVSWNETTESARLKEGEERGIVARG